MKRYGRMPMFYFHLHNDMDVPDEEGREFPDLAAACDYARKEAIFEASYSALEHGRIVLNHRIDVEDENGAVLATVHFGDAVQIVA